MGVSLAVILATLLLQDFETVLGKKIQENCKTKLNLNAIRPSCMKTVYA